VLSRLRRFRSVRGRVALVAFAATLLMGSAVAVTSVVALDGDDERGLEAGLALLIGAGAVVAGAVAWWAAGQTLRPVQRMARRAERISAESPARRLPVAAHDHELAELGRALNRMLARIAEGREQERQFLDDASHELRTPLTILRGELELAQETVGDPAATRAALASALEEVERLTAITTDLLTLARADSRGLPLRHQAVDLNEFARRAAARASAGGEVQVSVEGHPLVAHLDPRRVQQILTNLLSNAVRHARSHVVVSVTSRPGAVVLSVSDDGPGFPEALLPRAFERFVLAKAGEQASRARTGLGLAIVAALAEAHGGAVTAGNGGRLGGAVVEVVLPATGASESDDPAADEPVPRSDGVGHVRQDGVPE
jgi:signal transduction histidine kinase